MPAVIIIIAIAAAGFLGITGLVLGAMGFKLIMTYVNAKAANAMCPFPRLIGMRLRKLDPSYLVENMIGLRNAGIDASYEECESHVMSGGCLEDAVDAMISAHKSGLDIDFRRICAIDLAGRDVVRAIQSCVNPITIDISARVAEYLAGVHDVVAVTVEATAGSVTSIHVARIRDQVPIAVQARIASNLDRIKNPILVAVTFRHVDL